MKVFQTFFLSSACLVRCLEGSFLRSGNDSYERQRVETFLVFFSYKIKYFLYHTLQHFIQNIKFNNDKKKSFITGNL